MEGIIREIKAEDKASLMQMMRDFYTSPAVHTNGSDEIFSRDIESCINGSPYTEGYVFDAGGDILGYAMIAKSYSTEFGKACIWIEDLYVKDKYRAMGLGSRFLDFITEKYTDCIFRLEVDAEDTGAVRLYEQYGFTFLPYQQMKK